MNKKAKARLNTILELKEYLTPTQNKLIHILRLKLEEFGYKNVVACGDYVFAKGKEPYMLTAHMDTVHKEQVKDIYSEVEDYRTISSPEGIGGDDRCGIYIIIKMLEKGLRPNILFCADEEIGCVGASVFAQDYSNDKDLSNMNFIIEFDRRGMEDVVRYEDDNLELTEALEKCGYKRATGTCSDIVELSPVFGCSSVNLSSGYYKEHHVEEFIDIGALMKTIDMSYKFLTSEDSKKHYDFVERVYTNYYRRGDEDWYKDDKYWYDDKATYDKCDVCGKWGALNYVEGMMVCEDCSKDMNYEMCENCSEYFERDQLTDENGYTLCQECNEYYNTCFKGANTIDSTTTGKNKTEIKEEKVK